MIYENMNIEDDCIAASRIVNCTLRDVYILAEPGLIIERCRLGGVIVDKSELGEFDDIQVVGCFCFGGVRAI